MRLGPRKWQGSREGLVLVRLRRKARYFNLLEIARNVDVLTAHDRMQPSGPEVASAVEHQDLPLRHLRQQPPGQAFFFFNFNEVKFA